MAETFVPPSPVLAARAIRRLAFKIEITVPDLGLIHAALYHVARPILIIDARSLFFFTLFPSLPSEPSLFPAIHLRCSRESHEYA